MESGSPRWVPDELTALFERLCDGRRNPGTADGVCCRWALSLSSRPWHGTCFTMDIVTSLRTAALALIVALIGAPVAPACAAQRPSACGPAVASAHSCCKSPTLKACCADASERSSQSVPAQSRVEVNPNVTAAPAVLIVDAAAAHGAGVRFFHSGPLFLVEEIPAKFLSRQ